MEPQNLDDLRSVEELVEYQKELKGRQAELNSEFDGLPFPDEFRDEFAGIDKDIKEVDRRVLELEARRRAIEENALRGNVEKSDGVKWLDSREAKGSGKERDIFDLSDLRIDPTRPDESRVEARDRALRAVELMRPKHPHANREDAQTHVERLIETTQESQPGEMARYILTYGSPTYRRAWGKNLFGQVLTREEQRALSLGATTGGQAVPVTLDPTVIPTSNSVVNPARSLARVETIVGSNTWNGVSSGAITATRVAEAAAATDNTPTMAAPTLTVTKAHAFVPFSVEIQEDWGALEQEMARLFQDAKDDEEATAFVTGAGTGVNPQGFVTGTTTTVAAATGLTVTAANLYALEAALPPRFRPNESFVANRGIYNVVRGIDTAGGAALWLYVSQGLVTQAPAPGNTGATLLGRGAWEASAMQATVVNATKIMVVGDFSYFLIVDRIGLNLQSIPFLFGAAQGNLPTGQAGLYAWWRNSSKVLSASAFVALTGTT
jgi:HK97 family phage major capsid protein